MQLGCWVAKNSTVQHNAAAPCKAFTCTLCLRKIGKTEKAWVFRKVQVAWWVREVAVVMLPTTGSCAGSIHTMRFSFAIATLVPAHSTVEYAEHCTKSPRHPAAQAQKSQNGRASGRASRFSHCGTRQWPRRDARLCQRRVSIRGDRLWLRKL